MIKHHYHADVMKERLLTTHGEQLRREEHLRRVAERQRSAEERIRGLELKLEAAQKQKDEEVGSNKLQGLSHGTT